MLAGSFLIGFAVVAVAFWLEYNDWLGWPNDLAGDRDATTASDERYRIVRRRWRRVLHMLIAACGALMAAAGMAGPGRFWIAAWTAVALLMMTIIVLALADALRTQHQYALKANRSRDQSTSRDVADH